MYDIYYVVLGRKGKQVVAEQRFSVVEWAVSQGGGVPKCTITNIIKDTSTKILDHVLSTLHRRFHFTHTPPPPPLKKWW